MRWEFVKWVMFLLFYIVTINKHYPYLVKNTYYNISFN